MFVEDNIELLLKLRSAFGEKYNVLLAKNGIEALKIINDRVIPDLIISDILMDDMDGFELFKVISESQELKHIHRLFLTAKTGIANKYKGLGLGAYDVVYKPFQITELVMKVDSIMCNIVYNKDAFLVSARNFIEKDLKMPKIKNINLEREKDFDIKYKEKNISIREQDIVKLIIEGKSNKEIASILHLAYNTVSTHVYNIFGKIGVNSRTELIHYFMSVQLSKNNF